MLPALYDVEDQGDLGGWLGYELLLSVTANDYVSNENVGVQDEVWLLK